MSDRRLAVGFDRFQIGGGVLAGEATLAIATLRGVPDCLWPLWFVTSRKQWKSRGKPGDSLAWSVSWMTAFFELYCRIGKESNRQQDPSCHFPSGIQERVWKMVEKLRRGWQKLGNLLSICYSKCRASAIADSRSLRATWVWYVSHWVNFALESTGKYFLNSCFWRYLDNLTRVCDVSLIPVASSGLRRGCLMARFLTPMVVLGLTARAVWLTATANLFCTTFHIG